MSAVCFSENFGQESSLETLLTTPPDEKEDKLSCISNWNIVSAINLAKNVGFTRTRHDFIASW